MHFSAVLVYDSGENGQWALSLDELKPLVSRRLAPFPLLRHRLYRVTMGMDTPYWVDSGEPDWDKHISEHTLDPPGDWPALQHLIGSLHGARMKLAMPLWEMHLIHGLSGIPVLPDNCQAIVLKIHHSAIDGISLAAIIDSLHQPGDTSGGQHRRRAPPPTLWTLWARANLNSVNRRLKLADTVQKLLPGVMRARETRQQFSDLPPVLRAGAHFNARVGSGRSTGAVLLPMEDVRAVKRAVRRVTLNDIAMACVAGALREYLSYHRRLPKKSLASGVPINLRGPADAAVGGNKIATMIVGLATDVSDPVERLRRIHRYAVAGKKHLNALGTGTIMDISDSLAPAVLAEGIRAIARASLISEMPVPFHTMISNVPGPPCCLRLGEARLVVPMGYGPIRDNMGLFHIVSSSETMLSLSFCACDKLMPDGAYYQQCLQNAFAALLNASRQQSP